MSSEVKGHLLKSYMIDQITLIKKLCEDISSLRVIATDFVLASKLESRTLTSEVKFDLRGQRSFLKKLHNLPKNIAEKIGRKYLEWSLSYGNSKLLF